MAIGPINYATGADSPLQAFQGGFSTGASIVNTQLQQRQQAMALDMQQSLTADARQVAQNPTPQAVAGLALKYPQLAGEMKTSFDMLNTTQQQARLNQAVPIYAAVQGGNIDTAVKLLNTQADGFEASGDKQQAAQSRVMAQLVANHPEQAKTLLGIPLAAAMGPEKFADTFAKLGGEARANELQPATVAKTGAEAVTAQAGAAVAPQAAVAGVNKTIADTNQANAGAAKTTADIAFDKDKLKTETQLKLHELSLQYGAPQGDNLKLVNDSVGKALTANAVADRFTTFADKYEQIANSYAGKAGNTVGNLIRDAGLQDEWANMRNEYNRLRTQGIAANLPPQVTRLTDSDIKIFGKGIPTDADNPQTAAAFMRSIAVLKKVEALTEDAKSQWAAANRSLGPAKEDMNIGGVDIAAKTTLPDFMKTYLTNGIVAYKKGLVSQTVQSRPYMSYATGGQ